MTEVTELLQTMDHAELTEVLQNLLPGKDVGELEKLSKDEKRRRIYGRLASPVSGRIVDLKSKNAIEIADGLWTIGHAWKGNKGFDKSDALELAESVIESENISNPKKLYSIYQGKGAKLSKSFQEFRFNIGWQTDDQFPLLTSGEFDDFEIMKSIYYRVSNKPSESHWGMRMNSYKKQLLESMDKKYRQGDTRLPEWFEDKAKYDLERQCSECRTKMQEEKQTNVSKKTNIVYLWSVFLGKEFSKRYKHRSYAGSATGGNSFKDRWGQHFRAALQLIKFLLKCDMVPRKPPDFIQFVDLVLALAIANGYESALYCVGSFHDPASARNHESKTIKSLKLIQLDRGLNRKT